MVWISRLIRDGSGRVVRSVVEFAENNKAITSGNTGRIRNLLDDVSAREAHGAAQVDKSVGNTIPGSPAIPASRRKLHIPDLSAMPSLRTFMRGGPADEGRLKAILSGFNQRYGLFDVHVAQAGYLRDRPGFDYHASVRAPGEGMIGMLQRKIYYDEQGKIVVENVMMDLFGKDATGKGFATSFNSAMESYYRRCGVDRIKVFATDDGGYVWARAGYEFDLTPEKLESSVSSITTKIRTIYNDCSDAERIELDDMLSRFERKRVVDYPTPNELASLGHDGALGERLMKDTAWHGVRVL
ncbi:hypothetical protein [Nocardia sp. NPDC003963]